MTNPLLDLRSLLCGWTVASIEGAGPGCLKVRAVRKDGTREMIVDFTGEAPRARRVRISNAPGAPFRIRNVQELYGEVVEYLAGARGREVTWIQPILGKPQGIPIKAMDVMTGETWDCAYTAMGYPPVRALIAAMEIGAPRGEPWDVMILRAKGGQ